ncbi:MAG: cupin domain-containing protein [Calditrichaeota bacterium]|nr:MAG: cupin domain-containing protein [Calditrichota bacterium]
MKTADYWIEKLNLASHPEGGYFRETYRSDEKISREDLPQRFAGDRDISTAIYFLLKSGQRSLFHRIKSDELWHFYSGSPLTIHMISTEGHYTTLSLGTGIENGQHFQCSVPAGIWFGATVDLPNSFSLVGCTVAPGFDFADFEFGKYDELVKLCPEQKNIIALLSA